MALSRICAGSTADRFFACPLRSSSSSGVVLFFRWLDMSFPTRGHDMLPRDPDVFRELFELRFRGARLALSGEFDTDAERRTLIARSPLAVRGREPALDQLRRQRLGGLLVGCGEELGIGGSVWCRNR